MKTPWIITLCLVGLLTGCSQQQAPKKAEQPASSTIGSIVRLDPAIDAIIPQGAKIEKVAGGYEWTEGPVWSHSGDLFFAAIHHNSIMEWIPGQGTSVLLHPSGYQGTKKYPGPEPGSNGMTIDKEGRLVVAAHARREIFRLESLEPGAKLTVLCDRYQGKRLNSPNDLVYTSDGSLYFTDPPYGLPTQGDKDPLKELPFNGVFRLPNAASHKPGAPPDNRHLQLVIKDLTRPNGIAFSPDEKYLYIAVSDPDNMVWMRYDVKPNGMVAIGKVFCKADSSEGIGTPDGIKVDEKGNLYGAGPGGLWIISPEGKHIGGLKLPERAANCAWGGPDGKTLYITASSSVYRIELSIPGVRP
ncbi:MAG TPA: SMP-30/gluconolactonase/LRE family protein [Terriglobia bacterium]|nr:SMP-30/gluconolactonase/LRE family protein [Terriglobia bacterium]